MTCIIGVTAYFKNQATCSLPEIRRIGRGGFRTGMHHSGVSIFCLCSLQFAFILISCYHCRLRCYGFLLLFFHVPSPPSLIQLGLHMIYFSLRGYSEFFILDLLGGQSSFHTLFMAVSAAFFYLGRETRGRQE
ncbi:hypothetical protein BS50DRAFT_279404 [Corynespora cassiicola Philippines]|uniref:Uncharacterized protein n=1 Tax=Corynespora cassiicola Philippines TaxID=1448308 RepID=A0A2T2P0U0_CORCC|nr:hypothetical protein BS50DRAFT_279404 [Corynespora cassiicola Philippines]